MPSRRYPFYLVNAFTSSPFGGNPAAIVLLDAPFSDTSTFFKIAANLNQPMACFIYPIDDAERGAEPDGETKTLAIRWFTPIWESHICGHGTLAAAHALLARPELVPERVKVLRFKSMHGYVYARLIKPEHEDAPERIEIELPAFDPRPVDSEEFDRVKGIVRKAFRKDVRINYIGISGSREEGSHVYLLIELDEKEALEGVDVDATAFAETAPYRVNIITVKSKRSSVTYHTRMFAPMSGIQEDSVCGSANCLMAPYWANKLGIESNGEMRAKQVSARGGELWVFVDKEKKKVLLQGEAKLTAAGEIYL